jgi:zinc carboxypeptidase
MSPRDVVPYLVAALVLLAVTLAVPRSPPTRVAIRVDCRVPDACERARAVALDIWSEDEGPNLPLDVVVVSDALPELAAWQLLVPDIDAAARAERERLTVARPADWFGEYRDYTAIGGYLRQLAELAPDRASVHVLGGSLEGRPLLALRVAGRAPDARMLVDGTQHAREWISSMVATCVADRLVRGYASDPAIRAFVDRTELWVVPVVNPDGYQYSWAQDRYWRKNRRDRHGVDLNRNFSVAWGGPGSSSNERSQTYRGAYAFSEPESAALRDLVRREGFSLAVDFHAYGQLVLYPWAYTRGSAPDRAQLAGVGDRMASAIYAAHENRYALQSGAELYPASGTLLDFMYGDAGALSYTIELRPKSGSGFVLPPEEIRPTCDEGLAAVLALRASR